MTRRTDLTCARGVVSEVPRDLKYEVGGHSRSGTRSPPRQAGKHRWLGDDAHGATAVGLASPTGTPPGERAGVGAMTVAVVSDQRLGTCNRGVHGSGFRTDDQGRVNGSHW